MPGPPAFASGPREEPPRKRPLSGVGGDGWLASIMMVRFLQRSPCATVPLDRWSRSYPRAAVAPAMGSLREANFTKDLTPTDDPFLL